MNQLGGFPLLTLVICLPLLGAVVTLAIPRDRRETTRWIGLLTAASDLLVALFLILGWVNDPSVEMQFVDGPWSHIASLGIGYHVGVDGISLLLVLLTVFLVPLTMLLSAQNIRGNPSADGSIFWMLILEFGLLGALSALDLLLLTSFWIISLLAVVRLAHPRTNGPTRQGQLMVLAAIAAASLIATAVGAATSGGTYSLSALRALSFPWQRQTVLFWASVVACSLTAAAFPWHVWYVQACSAATMPLQLLTGALLLNLGVYGLVRVSITLFPLAAVSFAPLLVIAGSAGLIYGASVALGQEGLHDVIVHWRIAQTGLVLIGIFALDDLGLHGALLHSVASSLAVAALLVLAGGTDSQLVAGEHFSRFRRIGATIGFMSAIGVPGLAGFLGQSLLVMQILRWAWSDSALPKAGGPWDWLWRTAVYGGMLLSVGALLRMWRRVTVQNSVQPTQRTMIGLLIVVLIVALGLRPLPASDTIGPAVYQLLNHVEEGVEQDLEQLAQGRISIGPQHAQATGPTTGDDPSGTPLQSSPDLALGKTR